MKLSPLPLEAAQSPHHLWQALTELVFIKPQTLLFIPKLSPQDW